MNGKQLTHKVSLLENIEYGDSRPIITVLIDTEAFKEIRIVFRKGQQMKEHKTGQPIIVEVVDGSINFGVNGKRHLLNKGTLVALEASVPHDLVAEDDSIVRLSLSKVDDVSRVKQIIK